MSSASSSSRKVRTSPKFIEAIKKKGGVKKYTETSQELPKQWNDKK